MNAVHARTIRQGWQFDWTDTGPVEVRRPRHHGPRWIPAPRRMRQPIARLDDEPQAAISRWLAEHGPGA